MFGKRIRLFTLLGFEVRVDLSWVFLGLLILVTLAQGLFPALYPELPPVRHWLMAAVGLVGLMLSIVIHEFSHSLVARRYGMPIHGITLFIFGGVAEMDDEPPSARAEFLMAAAGPLASFVLAIAFYQLWQVGETVAAPAVSGILLYLAYLNALLGVFNLLPAFPLDGGRMLRAVLWRLRGDMQWATRWAARLGAGFGWLLVALGIWQVLAGNFVGGLWWVLIGLFLRGAARGSYSQLLLRDQLQGMTVRRVMDSRAAALPPSATVADLMQRAAAGARQRFYPVMDGAQLLGCVSADIAVKLPRPDWERHNLNEYLRACPHDPTVTPESNAMAAFSSMARHGYPMLVITDEHGLAGTVNLSDVVRLTQPPAGSSRQHWRA